MQNQFMDSTQARGMGTSGSIMARTYGLLAATLAVSGYASWYGMASPFVYAHRFVLMIVGLALLFAIRYTGGRGSPMGVPLVFLFAACMGAVMGPEIAFYLHAPQGGQVVTEALGATAFMFVGLSFYGALTRRNFSHIAGFLITGLIVGIIVSLVNVFFLHIQAVQLAVAGVMVLVFSGLIVWDTQRMVRGGINNPVLLVVGLYLDIINLFMALLEIFGSRS